MQTPDPVTVILSNRHGASDSAIVLKLLRASLPLCVGMLLFFASGCSKDSSAKSIETDANGYLCLKCNAKLYTNRKVFLEKCPKCNQDALASVVGYLCEKDHHTTLRPKVSSPEGASVCEQCGLSLKNAMFQPHKKDLEAWGATKAGLPQAH